MICVGRDSLEIGPIIGHPYGSFFKMSLAENSSKKKKIFNLELAVKVEDFENMFLDDESGGTDNRNIFDAAAFFNDAESSQKVLNFEVEYQLQKFCSLRDLMWPIFKTL